VHFYLMKTIKEEFDRNNIQIPFPQRVVTMKEPVKAAKPVAKPLGIIKKKKK